MKFQVMLRTVKVIHKGKLTKNRDGAMVGKAVFFKQKGISKEDIKAKSRPMKGNKRG